MARRPRTASSGPPLPPRDGLGPARVRLPADGTWPTVVAFLAERTGDPDGVCRRVGAGEVFLGDGTPVVGDTPYRPGTSAYLYRDLPQEAEVPGELTVLLHDEETGLLAVDKPPFLATMPRGRHVAQTAVVRLRRELDLPDIVPVHRLDRLTSGVLLLTTRQESRAAYHRMVQAGGLAKTYRALAPLREGLDLPLTVRNRLVKRRGTLQTGIEAGAVNAVTRVDLEEVVTLDGRPCGRYRLTPTTGQTHQLRVHLAGLGIPILGDPLYPEVVDVTPDDFTGPLQLLAAWVRFTDPLSGDERDIRSRRELPVPTVR